MDNANATNGETNTPTAAKRYAIEVAGRCFNDEIRVVLAREVVARTLPSDTAAISAARDAALLALGALQAAYDRQYRD